MENGDLNHQNTYLAAYARDKGHKPGEAVDYNELQSEYLDKNSKENSDVVKIV
ncbi:7211_t:CDS:1, partial [Funneliformis geosporum]